MWGEAGFYRLVWTLRVWDSGAACVGVQAGILGRTSRFPFWLTDPCVSELSAVEFLSLQDQQVREIEAWGTGTVVY